ncbi:MAG TPA: hypothetical protein VFS30_17000 [Dehalococcoidia bacterium]|nr:hypothetical protein [Dehalococcoidia bacterium]
MSEFEPKIAASMDPQLEMLVAQLESKFIDAEDALSELRHAVRQLKTYRPPVQASDARPVAPAMAASPTQSPPATGKWAVEANGEAAVEEAAEVATEAPSTPKLDVETVGVPFWSGPMKTEPEPSTPKTRFEDYGLDSTSEGSWPVGRTKLAEVERRAEPEAPVEAAADAAAIESEAPEASESNEDDDEARRQEVAQIVAQMRGGADEEAEPESSVEPSPEEGVAEPPEPLSADEPLAEDDDEARRKEVARMVAEMRAGGAEGSEPGATSTEGGDSEPQREGVANMVAQMRAELDGGGGMDEGESAPAADDPDAEVRDEVRRAVEAARAEMASGYKETEDADGAIGTKFSFPDWQSTRVEPMGPPVIVIKDSEGRVELARVYETLSLVHCDENAALLNYTPHSVTVGLNAKAAVPDVEALTEAVRATFGRACEVDSDGVRVNVQIGKDLKGKDSAA